MTRWCFISKTAAGAATMLMAAHVAAQSSNNLIFADSFEPATLTITASAVAPWHSRRWVDALDFSSRSGLSTVWGSYWETSESVFTVQFVQQTQELGNAAGGNHAVYNDIDLGSGVDSMMLRVSLPLGSASGSNTVEIRNGSVSGPLLGSCNVGSTGAAESYRTIGCDVDPALARGRQNLVFRFLGANTSMRFNWFAFYARGMTLRIDDIIKDQSTSMVNRPAPITPLAGTAVRNRSQLPAVNLPLAQSFGLWSPGAIGECPKWLHDTHWVLGDDGKVYPTWHPPLDFDPDSGRYCTYGHDHGDDPRGSEVFAVSGMPPFGYVNEQDSPDNTSLQRREDHFGHKVLVGNNWQMYAAVGGQSAVCDVIVKQHMGSHSPDALVNTAHEVFFAGQCAGQQPFNIKQFALFGAPGSFKEAEAPGCGLGVTPGLAPNPNNQPVGGVHRAIPTRDCYLRGSAGEQAENVSKRTVEFWLTGMLGGDLYTAVTNPARFYDQTAPSKIGRTVDFCYTAGHPLAATLSCGAAVAASPTAVPWNDPRSPFRGSLHAGHHFSALRFADSANAIVYTNAYGQNSRPAPDAGLGITVKQLVPRTGFYFKVDGHNSLFPTVDYSAGGRNGVRAPN